MNIYQSILAFLSKCKLGFQKHKKPKNDRMSRFHQSFVNSDAVLFWRDFGRIISTGPDEIFDCLVKLIFLPVSYA